MSSFLLSLTWEMTFANGSWAAEALPGSAARTAVAATATVMSFFIGSKLVAFGIQRGKCPTVLLR